MSDPLSELRSRVEELEAKVSSLAGTVHPTRAPRVAQDPKAPQEYPKALYRRERETGRDVELVAANADEERKIVASTDPQPGREEKPSTTDVKSEEKPSQALTPASRTVLA